MQRQRRPANYWDYIRVEELLSLQSGVLSVSVNPATARARLVWDPAKVRLGDLLRVLAQSPPRSSTALITAGAMRKLFACRAANTCRAEVIRPRWRARPITAAVPATLRPRS